MGFDRQEVYVRKDYQDKCVYMNRDYDRVISEFNNSTKEFVDRLSAFGEADINHSPRTGSWTPAQVGRHLQKSYHGIAQLLNGPSVPTARDPGDRIGHIKSDFLNFERKMQSPEFVRPEDKSYDKKVLVDNLERTVAQIRETASRLDLTETCTAFSLPVYGEMTRLEWIYFIVYHTKRHTRQLKTIAQTI